MNTANTPCQARRILIPSPTFGVHSNSPLVFSLLPRCHGECGSQKKIGMPVAVVNSACLAISAPWSQVIVRASDDGSAVIASRIAASTLSALFPSGNAAGE